MSRKNKFLADHRPEADLHAECVEEELRWSESRIATILAIAADAIISLDNEMRITLFNEGAERLFGYAQGEILGQPLDTLIPERFRSRHRKDVRDFAALPVAARRMAERQPIYALRNDHISGISRGCVLEASAKGTAGRRSVLAQLARPG